MKYLCAYALAWLSGKTQPKASDLADIINAIGGDFDTSRAESLCDLLAERDLTQVIKAGLPKLQAFAGAAAASSAPATTTEGAKEEKAEDKKEDKKEKEEVEDIEGAMDLFGGDEW